MIYKRNNEELKVHTWGSPHGIVLKLDKITFTKTHFFAKFKKRA